MNIKHIMTFYLCTLFITASIAAHTHELSHHNKNLDISELRSIKNELELTKKILMDIRDAQHPSLVQNSVSSLGTIIKELCFITTSLCVGAGATVLALGYKFGYKVDIKKFQDKHFLSDNATVLIPSVLIGLPTSTFAFYSLLKIVFEKLLTSSDKKVFHLNIKESLVQINQTITMIEHEVKHLENLLCHE